MESVRTAIQKRWFYIPTALICLCALLTARLVEGCVLLALLLCGILLFGRNPLDAVFVMMAIIALGLPAISNTVLLDPVFLDYAWLLLPILLLWISRVLREAKPISFGPLMQSLAVQSLAFLAAGLGTPYFAEGYRDPSTLFYILLLGPGMMLICMGTQGLLSEGGRAWSIALFAEGMVTAGLIGAVNTIGRAYAVFRGWATYTLGWTNDMAGFLIMTLPFAFYLAHRNRLWLLSAYIIYTGALFTSSRSAAVFGSVIFLLCLIAMPYSDRRHARFHGAAGIAIALAGAIAVILWLRFSEWDTTKIKHLFSDRGRLQMVKDAWQDFLQAPWFGKGLGYLPEASNGGIYGNTMWIYWYHNLEAQLLASMGTVGILCYAAVFYLRGKIFLRSRSIFSLYAAFSTLGLFLYSQVNPGELVPIPHMLFLVWILLFTEREATLGLGEPLPPLLRNEKRL